MRGEFQTEIRKAYEGHQIFCEADLQSFAWRCLKDFLEDHEEFRVLNKPFLRECHGTYPDLVIFRKKKPWVVVELKESKKLKHSSALKEREKLVAAKAALQPKRGYLVYVARSGDRRALPGPKGKAAWFFFEVPILLSEEMDPEAREKWRQEFRAWSKYVRNPVP